MVGPQQVRHGTCGHAGACPSTAATLELNDRNIVEPWTDNPRPTRDLRRYHSSASMLRPNISDCSSCDDPTMALCVPSGETYKVWDISDWPVMSQEARGLDPKDWVVPPDEVGNDGQAHWWLFKPIKAASYRRFDDWSEKIASELARHLQLPAAIVELANGAREEGILSRNVTPNGWSMESGDTMLSELEGYVSCATDDRPKNRVGHNLPNIAAVLHGCSGPPGTAYAKWSAMEVFAGYLVFDAWIANTDRHAINWAVLTREQDGQQALAASFDHGSALASGTQDGRLSMTSPQAYAERGFAGRFEDGSHETLVELAVRAVETVDGLAPSWLERLAAIEAAEIEDIVGRIPGMSEVRRTFLCSLLTINQRRLTS